MHTNTTRPNWLELCQLRCTLVGFISLSNKKVKYFFSTQLIVDFLDAIFGEQFAGNKNQSAGKKIQALGSALLWRYPKSKKQKKKLKHIFETKLTNFFFKPEICRKDNTHCRNSGIIVEELQLWMWQIYPLYKKKTLSLSLFK